MKDLILLDSTALWGYFDRTDPYHERASQQFEELFAQQARLVVSDYILDEVLTGIRMRTDHRSAVRAGEGIRSSRQFWITTIDSATWDLAWKTFKKYDRLRLSFTDCTSYALMQAKGIRKIFTFDRDFKAIGCDVIP